MPKGNKGKGKGKRNDRSQTPPPLSGKGGESRKGNSKNKPAITQGKASESAAKVEPTYGFDTGIFLYNPSNTAAKGYCR